MTSVPAPTYALLARVALPLVSLVPAGHGPQAAAAACGASRATGYRLWRRHQKGGWVACRGRPCVPRHQPRRLSRARAAHPGGARVREGRGR